MGAVYWRVTQRCIFGDFDVESSTTESENAFALRKAFRDQVVSKLEECFA